jgi:RND family efflux transporter MFP subunit
MICGIVSRSPVPWILLSLSVLACGGRPERGESELSGGAGPEPPTVIAVLPERFDAGHDIRLSAELEPYERASLYARATGFLGSVRVEIGDRVRKGELLAEIEVPEMATDVRRAEALLRKAEAAARVAELTHRRLETLRGKEPDAVSAHDLDVSLAEKDQAIAEAHVRSEDVVRLQALIEYAKIRAPFDGVISRRLADRGALVVAGDVGSEPIVEMARTDRLRLSFDLPESISPHATVGQELEFTLDAHPGDVFRGRVARTANTLSERTRSMRAEIDVSNEDGSFLPGSYATVRFPFREIPGAIVLPSRAVRTHGDSPAVFVVDRKELRLVDVAVLFDDGVRAIVRGELPSDAPVVTASSASLREGMRVRVRIEGETG